MKNRIHEIDGIRGWAALIVLMFHMTWEVFGKIFPEYRPIPVRFFLDGPFAVYVFFVLSGDALSNGYLRSGGSGRTLAKLVLKRYLRLAGPIFLSCLLVYALMKAGLARQDEASRIIQRDDWLGTFLPFDANFAHMVRYAFMQVFTDHQLHNSYNPFLWPMSTELYCSFFVFGLLFSLKFLKRPFLVLWLAAAWFAVLGAYFSLFFVGMAFSIMRERGYFDGNRRSFISLLSIVAVLAVIVLEAVLEGTRYKLAQLMMVMASVLVFAIYSNGWMVGFFSNRLSRYLGRISFPLYITHFAVIITVTSWEVIHFQTQGKLDLAHSAIVVSTSVLAAFVVAELFARLEERYLSKLDALVTAALADKSTVSITGEVSEMAR